MPNGLHFGAFGGQNLEILGSWGSPGGPLGAMLEPMAGQRGASSQKRHEKVHPWEPILDTILDVFSDFGCFFGGLISNRFLDGF